MILMSRSAWLAAAVAAATSVSAAAVSSAASPVVPPGGKIAGQGYGQWLRNNWQMVFAHTPGGASACGHHDGVLVLAGGDSDKREMHTCTATAGAPIYVPNFSTECSTIEPPPFYGRTAAQLRRCARSQFKGTKGLSATVDGTRVRHYRRFVSASPVFSFHMPKKNILGTRKRHGRSAAFGGGLLIRGFPAGNHTIRVTGRQPSFRVDVTYRLRIA